MCKANDYIKQLTEIYGNIKRDCEEMELAILKENAKKQDWEHYIESLEIDEITEEQALYQIKCFKEIRDNRRKYKNEFETLKQLKKEFIDKNLNGLLSVAKDVQTKDNTLQQLVENKVYNSRIDSQGNITFHSGNTRAKELQHKLVESESPREEMINKLGYVRKTNERLQITGVKNMCYVATIFHKTGGISQNALIKPEKVMFD